ncbi:MAG: hypothetical protein OR999_12545 [Arenicellales bacterium]|nr:hypothetical protein [Arenicellales bacterium]
MAKWPRKVSVAVTSLPYVVQSFAVFLTLEGDGAFQSACIGVST